MPVELTGPGTLYSFTTVHRAPPGLDVPFRIGLADFSPDYRLIARMSVEHDFQVGDPVWAKADATYGFRFAADGEPQ
jgi:uncharacterized OB-fold protein